MRGESGEWRGVHGEGMWHTKYQPVLFSLPGMSAAEVRTMRTFLPIFAMISSCSAGQDQATSIMAFKSIEAVCLARVGCLSVCVYCFNMIDGVSLTGKRQWCWRDG